jgi:hypothetical protein
MKEGHHARLKEAEDPTSTDPTKGKNKERGQRILLLTAMHKGGAR